MGPYRTLASRASLACTALVALVALAPLVACATPRPAFGPSEANERLLEETSLGVPREGNARPGDAVVRVWIGKGTCSGVLVAPRVVLTARHCVVELTNSGELTERPKVAGALHVELGGDYLPWGRVAVTSVSVCEPSQSEERDLAALVLERAVPRDVPLLTVGSPSEEHHYRVVGFGSAVWPKSVGGITAEAKRRHGKRGSVKSTSDDTVTIFAPTTHGDSGGAVIDRETHALVAVVSRGDYAQHTMGVRYDDLTIGARVDRCAGTVDAALARAGSAPRLGSAIARQTNETPEPSATDAPQRTR